MPKSVAPLSEERINTANPSEKTYSLFDDGGLFLLVKPDGRKRWRLKYRFGGKEKALSFGMFPDVSLNDARSRRDLAKELLAQVVEPSAVRKEEKARDRAERLEIRRTPSLRVTIDGKIEIWKGGNVMRLERGEAQFIANLLSKIVG